MTSLPGEPRPARPAAAARGRRRGTTIAVAVALGAALAASWRQGYFGDGAPPSSTVEELLAESPVEGRATRLAGNPRVLVIQFPSLQAQGAAMNRIAALVEKTGAPRERVLGDPELAEFIAQSGDSPATFYLGHDYGGGDLARFYRLAAEQRVTLNDAERRLHGILVAARLLAGDGVATAAIDPPQALVTFSAVQRDDPATEADETVDAVRREAVLRHELSHGEFLTRSSYRAHCERFWRSLTQADRERFRRHLAQLGYDTGNETLVVNEMQALLMHTPDPRAFSAADLGVGEEELAAWRRRFAAEGAGKP